MNISRGFARKASYTTAAVAAAAGLFAGGAAVSGDTYQIKPKADLPSFNLGGGLEADGTTPVSFVEQARREITAYYANKGSDGWAADVERVDGKALNYLKSHAPRVKNPAIVLDIDETALNSQPGYELDSNYAYNATAWNHYAYVDKSFLPIKPTREIAKWADSHGIDVFYITGRRDNSVVAKDIANVTTATDGTVTITLDDSTASTVSQRTETAADLLAKGYPVEDAAHLILRPVACSATVTTDCDPTTTATAYKTAARAALESGGHTIVINVGDQWSDLNGGHADATFKLPNPMYFNK